jgi:tetrahydromethanopterin S-methyltransferase subunit G
MASSTNGSESLAGRITAIGRFVGTLDQKLIGTFETLDRLGRTAAMLDDVATDGQDLIADLRERLDRMEAKVNADVAELKQALLDKLADLDVDALNRRLNDLEGSIENIETAVTRLDTVMEGAVEAAPDFVTKRVRKASAEVAQELTG